MTQNDLEQLGSALERAVSEEVRVDTAGLTNKALRRPAKASSEKSSEKAASYAVDGNPSTRWTSVYADVQWISVDLGEVCSVSCVEITWEKACAADYKVQGSLDGETWSKLASETGHEGLVMTQLEPNSEARWVRVLCGKRATQWGFSIYNFAVYTVASVAPPLAVFAFPFAHGHLRPSYPMARGLKESGWEVEYVGQDPGFGQLVRDLGVGVAELETVACSRYDTAREEYYFEFGWTAVGEGEAHTCFALLGSVQLLMLLPDIIRYLKRRRPRLLIFCPEHCNAAHLAAQHLGIPAVSLVSKAGPGMGGPAQVSRDTATATVKSKVALMKSDMANMHAIRIIRETLKLPDLTLNTVVPVMRDHYAALSIVTCPSALQQPLLDADAAFYKRSGKVFEFVGPLLDVECAVLSGPEVDVGAGLPLGSVKAAVLAERPLVYVSMGTRLPSTMRDLCRAVFEAIFREFGRSCAALTSWNKEPFIVVSLGGVPLPGPLDGLEVPRNALCYRNVPQLELLRLKPLLFVTHCGQNSFMECLSSGVPLLACPGDDDQPSNGANAERLGVGLMVPQPPTHNQSDLRAYKGRVRKAACQLVKSHETFAARAREVSQTHFQANGPQKAVGLLLAAAGLGPEGEEGAKKDLNAAAFTRLHV